MSEKARAGRRGPAEVIRMLCRVALKAFGLTSVAGVIASCQTGGGGLKVAGRGACVSDAVERQRAISGPKAEAGRTRGGVMGTGERDAERHGC